MKRREFISLIGSASVAWPLAARAQQAGKLPTIGFLGVDASVWSAWTAAFVQRLRELGWIEGRTIAIEYRWAEGRPERNAEIAAEFVRLKVDVIVTFGTAVPAVKQATAVIPIVFAIAQDPVGGGLVTSLARPGGNVTGLSIQSTDIAGKRVELLREVVPRLADWQSWLIFPIPSPCWRWARSRPRLVRSASKSRHSKSAERRISLPPSRRSRPKRTHFTSSTMHSLTPTARASSRLRSARGCRRSSIPAIMSKPGASCPTDQTTRLCSGTPPSWSTRFARDKARRYRGRAADQIRSRHQPHDRQGARAENPRSRYCSRADEVIE